MTDKGLKIGWELWWERAVAKHFGDPKQKKLGVLELSERHGLGRSGIYEKLKAVSALLDPELVKCSGDLFLLIRRIQSVSGLDGTDGPAVAEVDLDTGEITYFEGWEEALETSLQSCAFDQHPASYLHILIEILEAERTRIECERKQLSERLSSVDRVLLLFRGAGRPRKIPDKTAKPSTSKGLSAPK
jgi:hypothetical protein